MIKCHATVYKNAAELEGAISEFAAKVLSHGKHPKGLCGFDGFIDTFIAMEQPNTMADFGSQVHAAAGISASFKSRHHGDKFGGNGPLIATALHGVFSGSIDIDCAGGFGNGHALPIFEEALGGTMRNLYPLAEPAHSDCLEFADGKIMLSDMRACADITWERLLECMGADALDNVLRESDFIAAVNWGKLVNVGPLWHNLAKRLKQLGGPAKRVLFFMDLAEFAHRPNADVEALLPIIADITSQCRTILSLNLKEAWQLAEIVGGDYKGKKSPDDVAELSAYLHDKLHVDYAVVHPNDGAACTSDDATVYVPGPFCADPLVSVGAGDNFGAGCLAGALAGLDETGMLLAGGCASGHYVRSGRAASFADMVNMLSLWQKNTLPDRL